MVIQTSEMRIARKINNRLAKLRSDVRHQKKTASKKYVKRALGKINEVKYYDKTSSGTVDASGTIVDISDIPQGDTDITRDGDKAFLKRLYVHISVTNADTTNIMRILIVQWYPNTTIASPNVNQILTSTGSALSCLGPYVHDYADQFNVLYDKTVSVDSAGKPQALVIKRRISLKYAKKKMSYTAATTAGSNKLFLVMLSDSTAVAHPTLNYYTRINFTDA